MCIFRRPSDFDVWRKETRHFELLGTILSVTDCGVLTVQTDVNILTFWLALKANFTDVRPQTLKMRQERFLTKGSFLVRSPHQRIARISRAPKARAKKN